MTRKDAQQAIDEAFADGLKRMFLILVDNLENQKSDEAVKEFTRGVSFHDEAHSKASAAIEQIFPE